MAHDSTNGNDVSGPDLDVAAGIVIRDGHVLVAKRRASDELGGLWEFPGGVIEAGETAEEALVRELAEELGVVTTVEGHWGALTHPHRGRTIRLHFHFATIRSGEPRPLDADELRWGSPASLFGLEFPSSDRRVLESLEGCQRAGLPLGDCRRDEPGGPEPRPGRSRAAAAAATPEENR